MNTVSPKWTTVTNAGVSPDAWLKSADNNASQITSTISNINNQLNSNRDAYIKSMQQDFANRYNTINQERLAELYNMQKDQLQQKLLAGQWFNNNAYKYMNGNKVDVASMMKDMSQALPNNIFGTQMATNLMNLGVVLGGNPAAFFNGTTASTTAPTASTTASTKTTAPMPTTGKTTLDTPNILTSLDAFLDVEGMHNNNKENNMDATEQLQKQLNGWMQNELGDALSTDLDVDSNGDKQLAKLAQATREKKEKEQFYNAIFAANDVSDEKADEENMSAFEKKANKEVTDLAKSVSLYEISRKEKEDEIRKKYDQLIISDPANENRYLQEYQLELNKLNAERELEKQGITPQTEFNINPYDPTATTFNKAQQKQFEQTSTLQQKYEWMKKAINKKRLDFMDYVEGEIELSDGDSGRIKGTFGDEEFRFNTINRYGERNGIFDAIDDFDTALANPNKWGTQSVLVHNILGIDQREAIDKQTWNAVHSYMNYLVAKYVNNELNTLDDYESFNINNIAKYDEYFNTHKNVKLRIKKLGKDVYNRTLIDVINENNESPVIGLTFNPILNAAFRVDKATDYIDSTLRMSRAYYELEELKKIQFAQEAQDKKDTDNWLFEKFDMFQARLAQVAGSLPAMFDFSEKFMSEYVLGKGAGAWREYITNQDKLNLSFGVRRDTWQDYQRDMEDAAEAFKKGEYCRAAAIYGSNVANLIVLSAPDMLGTIGLTAALATVAPTLGLGTIAGSTLGLFARYFLAGSILSGTAQTVQDMHDFEVKHGREMTMEEIARTWGMNGLGMSLEGVLAGGQLGRILGNPIPYLLATPRQIIRRTGLSLGLNVIEEAGTEAVQEYLQNSISAANVQGGNYINSLIGQLTDWQTHGAEALAGAISGGAMSGLSHIPSFAKAAGDIKSVSERWSGYGNHGTAWINDQSDKVPVFTPEQIKLSEERVNVFADELTSFMDGLANGTITDDFETFVKRFNTKLEKDKSVYTAADYLAARAAFQTAIADSIRYYWDKYRVNKQELENFVNQAYFIMFGFDGSKLSLKEKGDRLLEVIKSNMYGSGPTLYNYYQQAQSKNPNIVVPNPVHIDNNTIVSEGEYKALKSLYEAINNQTTPLEDSTFKQILKKEIKTWEDVHNDFMLYSAKGGSLFTLINELTLGNYALEDTKVALTNILKTIPNQQIKIGKGYVNVSLDVLAEGIKTQNKDVLSWIDQYSSAHPTFGQLIADYNTVSASTQASQEKLENLMQHQVNKYVRFGETLHSDVEPEKVVLWGGNGFLIGVNEGKFTIHSDQMADPNSNTNKVINAIRDESLSAINVYSEFMSAVFSGTATEALAAAKLDQMRAAIDEATQYINEYRKNAELHKIGAEPDVDKIRRASSYTLQRLLKSFFNFNNNQADMYIDKIAFYYAIDRGWTKYKASDYDKVSRKQREEFRSKFMNLDEKSMKDSNNNEYKCAQENYSAYIALKRNYNLLLSFKNEIIKKGKVDVPNILKEFFTSKSICPSNVQDTLNYLATNVVSPVEFNATTQFSALKCDFRQWWLSLTLNQRIEYYQLIQMVNQKNDMLDVGHDNPSVAERADFPHFSTIKNLFYNWQKIIDTDLYLHTMQTSEKFVYKIQTGYNADEFESPLLSPLFSKSDLFAIDDVTPTPNKEHILAFLKYQAENGKDGLVTKYIVNGQECYRVSSLLLGALAANPVLEYPKGIDSKIKDTFTACPMYQGVLNLRSRASTDRYIFRIAKQDDNVFDIIFADVKTGQELSADTSGKYLEINENSKLSFRNDNLFVKMTKKDGTVIKVQFADAVLLSQVFSDGAKAIDILEELDPNDTNLTNTIRVKVEEISKNKHLLYNEWNGQQFTEQDKYLHKTIFLDFLYLQAINDSGIDINSELGSADFVYTNSNIAAEAESVMRARSIINNNLNITTKEELLKTYGEANETGATTGNSINVGKQKTTVTVSDLTKQMTALNEVVICDDVEGFRKHLIEDMLPKFFFDPSLGVRTYRGLNRTIMTHLVNLMDENELSELYFSLSSLDGITPLDQLLLEKARTSGLQVHEEFYTQYDKNIDLLLNIPVISNLMDKYHLGSTQQELNDFFAKNDIALMNHLFEQGEEELELTAFVKTMEYTLGKDNELVKTLKVLTGKNFKERGNLVVDVEYEAKIKAYYWLQLQRFYYEGLVDDEVKNKLNKFDLTKDVSWGSINQGINILLSDGSKRLIYNPLNFTDNSGTKFSLGMNVEDLYNAGYTVKILGTTENMNAKAAETVDAFFAPIIEGGEKTVYIRVAVNTKPAATKATVALHSLIVSELKNDNVWKMAQKHVVSLEDAITEIFEDRFKQPATKNVEMINLLHQYGVATIRIKKILSNPTVKASGVRFNIEDLSNKTFGSLLEKDANGNYCITKDGNYILSDLGNKLSVSSAYITVNNQPIPLKTVLKGIANGNMKDLENVKIKSTDTLFIEMINTSNNSRLDGSKASIIDLEIPKSVKVNVQTHVAGTYAKKSLLAEATKNLTATHTGNVLVTIGDDFINLFNNVKNGTYTNEYSPTEITDLNDLYKEINERQKPDNLRRAVLISYNKKTRKYYLNGRLVKSQQKAAKLYKKTRQIVAVNKAMTQEVVNFLNALINNLHQQQGAKEVRFVVNISNKESRDLIRTSLASANIKVIYSVFDNALTDEVVSDFLAGSGITLAKIKSKYNVSNRAVVSGILGDGLAENRCDVIVSLGGLNAYLAQSLGDRCAVSGLLKTYIDDETETRFTEQYEQDVQLGKIDPDEGYIGMTGKDEDTLAVDTTDAVAHAIDEFNNKDIDAFMNALFNTQNKREPLFSEMQSFTTRKVVDVRANLNQRIELRKSLLQNKNNITMQNIYNSLKKVSNASKLNTYDPTDKTNTYLDNYIYYTIKANDSLVTALQMITYDKKNPQNAFRIEEFLQQQNITIKDNKVNQLSSENYEVVCMLLDDVRDIYVDNQNTVPFKYVTYHSVENNKRITHSFVIGYKLQSGYTTEHLLAAAIVHCNMQPKAKAINVVEGVNYLISKNVKATDLQGAINLVKSEWSNMLTSINDVKSFENLQDVNKAIQELQNSKSGIKEVKDKLGFNNKIQAQLSAYTDILKSYQKTDPRIARIQYFQKSAKGLLYTSSDLANIPQNTSTNVEDQIRHNSLVLSVINYISSYDQNQQQLIQKLNSKLIKIDNDAFYANTKDVSEIRERLERQIEATKKRTEQKKNTKKLKELKKAIKDAKTQDEQDIAWSNYLAYINGGLVKYKQEAHNLLQQMVKLHRSIGAKDNILANGFFDEDASVFDFLRDKYDIAEQFLGHYDDLLSQIQDQGLRDKISKAVDNISMNNGITLNIHDANTKTKLMNNTILDEVLVYLTDVKEDLKSSFIDNNKLDLSTLTNQQIAQILMVMIRKNPSLMLLYDIKVSETTGVISLQMRKEFILAAISAGSQTMDQFASLTTKSPEDVMRIMGLPSTKDAIEMAKIQKVLSEYGVPREKAYRQFGDGLLETLGLSYDNKSDSAKAFGKQLLSASLGRFVVDALISISPEIIDHDKNSATRNGKKLSKKFLSDLYGETVNRDVSFYKFNQKNASSVKLIGDYLATEVFGSVGDEVQIFQFDKPIDQKLKLAKGSVFRPTIYERDANGNIVLDANGNRKELSQLPAMMEETLQALNNEAFQLSNKNLDMLNDICDNMATYLRAYGYHTKEELKNMTEYEKISAQGENSSLIQQIEAVRLFRDYVLQYQKDNGKFPDKVYFDWETIVSGRVQLKGSIFNPQTNKILRGVLVAQGTDRTYNLTNKKTLQNELFAICQAFDITDAEGRKNAQKLLNDLDEEMADRLYKSLLQLSDDDFAEMWKPYGLEIEERTLALQAAYHLKLRATAKAQGQNTFTSNLMVEDDSTTSGYFLKICLFPEPKLVRDFALKVGVYDVASKEYYKNVLGIDLDSITDIDQLKKLPNIYDIYKTCAITTDEMIKQQEVMDDILTQEDEKGKKIIKEDLEGKTNRQILLAICEDKGSFTRQEFLNALPHVENKNGVLKVSKEFRELLKPIVMVFGYAAGHNSIVNKLGETVYDQKQKELRKLVFNKDVELVIRNMTPDEIDKLAPIATIFAYNLKTGSFSGNIAQGIVIPSTNKKGDHTNESLGLPDVKELFTVKNLKPSPFGNDNKRNELYKNLITYKTFIENCINGINVSEKQTDPVTGKEVVLTRKITVNPEDIWVYVACKDNKPTKLRYDMAIKNVFAITYGEATYKGLEKDFGELMAINDVINTISTISTNIFNECYTQELDKLLLTVNKKLVGMNPDNEGYEKERGIAFSRLTNKDIRDLYTKLYQKGLFPTGPNATSILGNVSAADMASKIKLNVLSGIQIIESEPANTMMDAIYQMFYLDTSTKNSYKAYDAQYSVYGQIDFVGSSGLRTAVSTIHSSDFYVLGDTVLEMAKQNKYATVIHDAMFMSALDQDVFGKQYNKSSLKLGQKYNVLTEYVKYFEAILKASGTYAADVDIAQGNRILAPNLDHLRYLADGGSVNAKKQLQRLQLHALIDNQGNYLGTKLSSIGFPMISVSAVVRLLGNPQHLKDASTAEVAKKLTIADVLKVMYALRDKYDNPVYGYRAKFYANSVTAMNLAGIGAKSTERGKKQKNVLGSQPEAWIDSDTVSVLLNNADTTKDGIIQLLQAIGSNEDAGYISRLTGLLEQFMDVETLLGWVVSKQSIAGNSRGRTLITQKRIELAFQSSANVVAGFSQSNAEIYVHELMHALFDFAFNNQHDPKIATAITKLRALREYVVRNKLITEEDFYDDTGITPEKAKEKAKKYYDYIFSEEATDDRGLKEFLSFVLTNERVFGKLREKQIQGQEKKGVLSLIFDTIKKMFQVLFGKMQTDVAFDQTTAQLSGTLLNNGETVYEAAVKLCLDIKKANTTAATLMDKARTVSDAATGVIDTVKDMGNKVLNPLLHKIGNIPNLSLALASGSKAEVAAKLIGLAPFNKEVRKGLREYVGMLGRELTGGFINDLMNDMKSSDEYTFSTSKFSRRANQVDQLYKKVESFYETKLREEFKRGKDGEILPDLTLEDEEALSVLLRGNLQCWLDEAKDAKFVQNELLLSSATRKNYIKNLTSTKNFPQTLTEEKKAILARFVKNMALNQAAVMVNAKGTSFFSSYDNSSTMVDRSKSFLWHYCNITPSKELLEHLTSRINQLASLYYLDKINEKDSKKLIRVANLSTHGVQCYLDTHQEFLNITAKNADKGSITKLETSREQGIVPGAKIYSTTADIKIAPISQRETMEYNGYIFCDPDLMVSGDNDMCQNWEGMKLKEKWGIFVKDLTVPTRISGTSISLTGLKDTSTSIENVLTEGFDLDEELRKEIEQQVADTLSGLSKDEQQEQIDFKTRTKKKEIYRIAAKEYSDLKFKKMFTEDFDYSFFENEILTSIFDGTRVRPYNYKDSINKMYLSDNAIQMLATMNATQEAAPEAYQSNAALIAMLDQYYQDNVRYKGGKPNDKSTGLYFLDIKNKMLEQFGMGVSDLLKDREHFYVREDMVKNILGVESWSVTNWKDSDGKNVIPPAFQKVALYCENLLRLFGYKAKENVVIRTPSVLFGNVMSNINIHLLTEGNITKILQMYTKNTQNTYLYLKTDKRRLELEYKVKNKQATEYEVRELARCKSALANNPLAVLFNEGMFTNIVEDLSTLEQENMADITQQLSKLDAIKNAPATGKNLFKQLYMLKGTPVFEILYHINQYSDFVARATEYQLQMEKCPFKPDQEVFKKYQREVLDDVWEKFIDYRSPVNRVEQYLNDIGFINFAKYWRRIQKVILKLVTKNPTGCLMQYARQCVLKPVGGDTSNVFTSNLFSKNYDTLLLGPEKAIVNTAIPGIGHLFGFGE